ncbi:torsin-1A-interacting protein 1-like [Ornithodoros turicata]|uniref:torsin-1A-interacting protein 1-like n=1 Tax=Ornithodoros turicata TaxID=34597 RepID=UPI003139328E
MSSAVDRLVRSGIRDDSSLKSTCRDENAETDDEDGASSPRETGNVEVSSESESTENNETRGKPLSRKPRRAETRRSRSPADRTRDASRDSSKQRHHTSDLRSKGRRTADKSSNELDFWKLACVAAIAVFAIFAFKMMGRSEPTTGHSHRVDVLLQHLRRLKQMYPGQPEHNWQIIRSSAVEVLNGSEAQHGPAVLLILAPPHNENLAKRIGSEVALALSYAFQDGGAYGEISLDDLTFSEDVIAAKHIIDRRCKSTFEEKRQHVILAPHIESWNPELAMMLHPLCDYENPLYENVAIVLTAFSEDIIGEIRRLQYDRMAEDVLNKAWDVMDTNQRHAIISRVTVNVIVLHDERDGFSSVDKQ